jgi:dephospho-CoA kinase
MIIGVTGTNGSGKGEVARYLVAEKGFTHFSSREIITEEIVRRGMPVNRDSMNIVANDMRATLGATYPQAQLFERARAHGGDAVIESVREVPGAELIRANGGFLVGVDADRKIRYERVVKRASSTDHVDFDTFVAQEEKEMQNPDPAKQNVGGVMKIVDVTLHNNTTFEAFHKEIDAALEEFKRKESISHLTT